MSFNNLLKDIKTNSLEDKSMNDVLIKSKFAKLFVFMRSNEGLEEIRTGLHASAIIATEGEYCLREQVLSLLFQQEQGEELPVKLLQIFAAGVSIHEKWQSMLEKCSGMNGNTIKLVKNEARSFSNKYELGFTPDSVIMIDNKKYIVEYKSMNDYAFRSSEKSNNPHPSARKQIQLYMFLTGIPRGIILLENKNTQEFSTYEVKFNYKEVLPYIERLYEIKEAKQHYLDTGNLPKRKPKMTINGMRCSRCNMKDACYQTGKGRIPLE